MIDLIVSKMKCVAVMCFLGMGFLLCVNALPIVGNPANLDGVKMNAMVIDNNDIAKEAEVDSWVGLKAAENAKPQTDDLAFHPENTENGKIYEIIQEELLFIKGDDDAFMASIEDSFVIEIEIAETSTIIDHAAAKAVFVAAIRAALVKVIEEGFIIKSSEEKDKEPIAVSSTSIDQDRKLIETVNEAKGPIPKPRSSSTAKIIVTSTATSTPSTTETSTFTTTSTTSDTDDTPYVPVDSDLLLDDGGR